MSNLKGMIQVWPDKFFRGISSLDGPHIDAEGRQFIPELGHPYSLKDALEKEFDSDAHLTCYVLKDKDGNTGAIPLMKKSVLKQIQAEGGNLLTTCIGLDWDTPGHAPLTTEMLIDFLEKLLAGGALDERLGSWRAYYTSRHGTRVFYELVEPVPVEDAEKYVTSIIKEWEKHNLHFDTNCRDWTRRFRLPKVVRDGLATQDEKMFDLQIQEKYLDIKKFKKADLSSLLSVPTFTKKATHPTQEECHALLYRKDGQGREVQTFFMKKAKRILKSCKYASALFEDNTDVFYVGGRNNAIMEMIGIITPILLSQCEATPDQIFALMYTPLLDLEPDAGTQNWHQHAWNALQDIYGREQAKYIETKKNEIEQLEAGEAILDKMAAGMRQWCEDERLFSEDNEVRNAYIKSHLFANFGSFFYPLTEDGWYSQMCLTKEQLIPRIKATYLNLIVCTEKLDKQGNQVTVNHVEVRNSNSTVVNDITMSPLQGVNGRITDMDGENPQLVLPMYQRNPYLAATYNDKVDGWLRAFFGENYDEAAKWIGYSLDFEAGPIAALSIKGPGGIGKKMLTEGLSECLLNPQIGTEHDMVGTENGALLNTPFLVCNEGLPRSRDMSPADTFKKLTAGDPIRIRQLYKPAVNVINPVRIIFTANDFELLHDLTKGKEINADTRRAMGERLLHFNVDSRAEVYLRDLGGKLWTEREGHRWIRGDSGQASNYVVAKHFLWLYENRPKRRPQDRYCVMGNCISSEAFLAASRGEHCSSVIRAIIDMVEQGHPQFEALFHLSPKGRLFVTMQGILAWIRGVMEDKKITERSMETALRSIMVEDLQWQYNGVKMYEVDVDILLDYADPWGIPCKKLRRARGME